jgi:predicted GTPase
MYVVGKTGTGKSSLLESLIRQDVLAGNGLALFDPHGDLAERLYAKAARIGNVHWPVRADNQTFHV